MKQIGIFKIFLSVVIINLNKEFNNWFIKLFMRYNSNFFWLF